MGERWPQVLQNIEMIQSGCVTVSKVIVFHVSTERKNLHVARCLRVCVGLLGTVCLLPRVCGIG